MKPPNPRWAASNAWHKRYRAKLKAAGMCIRECGFKAEGGRQTCADCRQKYLDYQRRTYKRVGLVRRRRTVIESAPC